MSKFIPLDSNIVITNDPENIEILTQFGFIKSSTSEPPKGKWRIQIFGDFGEFDGKDEEGIDEWEVSVIKTSNKLGQHSYGWSDENKIVFDRDMDISFGFALKLAKILFDGLMDGGKKGEEKETNIKNIKTK